jgi:hypothetical protein
VQIDVPSLDAFDDKKVALRRFEAFGLKLARAQPLPAAA